MECGRPAAWLSLHGLVMFMIRIFSVFTFGAIFHSGALARRWFVV
jgi:hypothetical protein